MRSMAPHASFRLDRGVLKDERSACLHMAFGADQVLIDGGPQSWQSLQLTAPSGTGWWNGIANVPFTSL
jgi:hypothetical protein